MVKHARGNARWSVAQDESREGCRYMSKADTEDSVVEDMSKHLSSVHQVDATELVWNIRATTKTTRK